jgi:hypothetical protein
MRFTGLVQLVHWAGLGAPYMPISGPEWVSRRLLRRGVVECDWSTTNCGRDEAEHIVKIRSLWCCSMVCRIWSSLLPVRCLSRADLWFSKEESGNFVLFLIECHGIVRVLVLCMYFCTFVLLYIVDS